MSIILPHEISYEYSSVKSLKSRIAKDILKIAQTYSMNSKKEYFFIVTLLNDASERTKKSRSKILFGIKELIDKKILIPIELSNI